MTSRFSFLLPAYKGHFLSEALQSIQMQTFRDFVCIVSDDCSPEDLFTIYNQTVGDDPRFVFRRNVTNIGGKSLVSHWNQLVDLCKTEFFIMASDDDVYHPCFLEEINRLTKKWPGVNLFRVRVKKIDENGNILINDAFYPEYLDQAHFFYKNFANDIIACESCYCYKTDALKEIGGYIDYPSAWFTDDATHIVLSKNGCVSSSQVLFSFRHSKINISNTYANAIDSKKKVEASLAFYKWVSTYHKNIVCSQEKLLVSKGYSACKNKITRNIKNNLQFCNWTDFRKLSVKAKNDLCISLPMALYKWQKIRFSTSNIGKVLLDPFTIYLNR